MGRIPDAWFDELRSRVNIVDVVSDYVVLKQKGRRFWGLCPFHGEKTASFSVDSETQSFYCFGCHKGGSVITFVMEIERMEFLDAVNLLSERAHLPLPERTQEPDADQSRALRERLYAANVEAARYYHAMLWRSEGAQALAYLHGRGLDDVGIRRFGLGAAPDGWDHLVRYLKSLGFREEEMKKAGLAGEKDGRYYDMFRNRAIFPIVNAQGKVLGFGGRILGDGNPKYLNTSDTPIFNKRLGLYAINMVKKERSLKRLILVEGYMDVVSLRNHGVSGVVATLGTALTEEQARLIKRYAPEVHVCYDGDGAGQKAILRALDIFEAADMPARVIDIPDDMDPDDYVKKFGAEGFEALGTVPPAEYRMRRAADGLNLENQEDRMKYAIACCEHPETPQKPGRGGELPAQIVGADRLFTAGALRADRHAGRFGRRRPVRGDSAPPGQKAPRGAARARQGRDDAGVSGGKRPAGREPDSGKYLRNAALRQDVFTSPGGRAAGRASESADRGRTGRRGRSAANRPAAGPRTCPRGGGGLPQPHPAAQTE